MKSQICAALGLLLLLNGCGFAQTTSRPAPGAGFTEYKVEKDLIYTPPGWPVALKADLYLPEGVGARPAVLLIYGGGWKDNDNRRQMRSIARKLAGRGYVVLNASYRGAPGYRYPAPLDDVREALRWLRANAAARHIDATRIAAYGYSAGGHLAALLGTVAAPPELRVQAVVAGGAPADLRFFQGGKLVPGFLGGTQQEIPDKYREASPVVHVTKDDPPFFLYHGTDDKLVPPEHPRALQAALARAGVPNDLYWIEGRGHAGAFIFEADAENRALAFLDRVLR